MTYRMHFSLCRSFLHRTIAAATGALAIGAAQADDIDVFAGGAGATSKPNVLIILDNSSNWSSDFVQAPCFAPGVGVLATDKKFHSEICALSTVALGLNDNVRLGLMLYNESGNNGAYVRFALRDMNTQNKNAFSSLMTNMVRNGTGTDSSGSNQPIGKAMFEAFKYYGGYTSPAHCCDDVAGSPLDSTHFGTTASQGGAANNSGTYRRDYVGNNSGGVSLNTGNRSATKNGADNNTAFPDSSSNTYTSPISDGCAKNFVIFIGNGDASIGGDSSPTDATTLLGNVNGNTAQILSGGSAIHANTGDEWARFLNTTDVSALPGQQKVITYTIAVYALNNVGAISNTDQSMIKLLRSMASAGGGKYFAATNASEVLQAILDILNEVQAVNSVFVSASLPVSVNTQGTFLNQVYMGMFRPDGGGSPRWLGNLKQYKINQAGDGSLFLADTVNAQAINPATGFVSPNAKSFWTSTSTFWTNNPSGTPASASDLPDGEVVEKGGAAEQIRNAFPTGQDTRRIYSCPTAGCAAGALTFTFDNANITGAAAQTAFGVATAAELTSLVNWVRGTDNLNGTPCDPAVAPCTWTSGEKGPGWNTTIRPSIHGDVLHSRPVVLNYPGGVGPWIFYGANDGTLRGTKGGRLATDGVESWAFVAPEFFGKFKRLKSEKPELLTPATPSGIIPTPQKKDYFFDGAIGSYQSTDLATEFIFVTSRRGGNVIYAFDVSAPSTPRFLWKKTPATLTEAPLGQTWSEPKAFKVKALADPVLMFGAGYDPAYDTTPTGTKTMGAGIYVLNARTGALVRFFQSSQNSGAMSAAVPSDIAAIDRDFDTFADRAYVGDMEGNVWRMDIDDANPANWKLFKLAALGTRKFFFRPDVVVSKNFDLVLLGSGDRETPLNTTSTDNFYMLKDTFISKDATGMVAITPASLVLNNSSQAAIDAASGWYLPMAAGEKVVNAPLSIAGIVYFATNKPTPAAPGVCSPNLGEARAYAVDFLTGGAGTDRNGDGSKDSGDISIKLTGGGLPPSPVGGVVQLDDGRLVDFVIGSGAGGSPLAPEKPPRTIPKVRRKLYWNTNSDT